MGNKKKALIQQLESLSREQAPDNWSKLRDRILAEKINNTESQQDGVPAEGVLEKRRFMPMKNRTTWIAAMSSAAVVIIAISLAIVSLSAKPAPISLEAGKTITLANGSLFINDVTPNGGKIGMPPDAEYIDLTLADLVEIFGRAPIPALPGDLKPDFETVSAMMFRSGSVFLMNGLSYSANPDDPKAARVFFDLNDRGELPLADCVFGTDKASVLNGIDMMVGLQNIEGDDGSYEMYTAQFIANGVGYRIRAVNMSGDAFVAILEAVIKG
jgi:hypothetical protein